MDAGVKVQCFKRNYLPIHKTIEMNVSSREVIRFLEAERSTIMLNGDDGVEYSNAPSMTPAELWLYDSALLTIKELWPELWREIHRTLDAIHVIRTQGFGGFTSRTLGGLIFLSDHRHDPVWILENIVHETAHTRFNQLLNVDPVVKEGNNILVDAPWRLDARPLVGLYHGLFSFTRIAMWLKRYSEVDTGQRARYQMARDQATTALQTLQLHHEWLTPVGSELAEEIRLSLAVLN